MESKHTRTLIYVGTSILAFVIIIYFFWVRPNQQLNDTKASLTTKEFIELKSSIRSGLAQALGGAALLIGLGFTWRNIRATEKNLILAQENIRATQETATKSLAIALEGQITERFTRAIEQLGDKESLAIRLGGIYGLERIAQDSRRDHWPIIEILCAFVRETAALEEGKPRDATTLTDVQAVLSVVSRRDRKFEDDTTPQINLIGVDLRGYELNHIRFDRTDLSKAHLEDAALEDAKFDGSTFDSAQLCNAHLSGASFKGARLWSADFTRSRLRKADFEKASLDSANLQGVILSNANFKHAQLDLADLRGAHVPGCNFEGASLGGTNLSGVNLARATGLTREQIDLAITNELTKFPEELQTTITKE